MSNLGEHPQTPAPIIQIEKFLSSKNTERWCKILSPAFPGTSYWLCQEARILQEFNHQHPFVARFIGVDIERRILVTEAPGFTLSQWLATPTQTLDHPFQRSSDLLRLMIAVCEIADALHKKGVVHGGLRPDALCINLDSSRHIDYTSIKLIDFGNAHSAQHRLEKPLFIDPDHRNANYLSPAMKDVIRKDWQEYLRVVEETDKLGWFELSERAKSQYETVLLSSVQANHLDWRVDMFSLGYWFSQISLHRIDYFNASHQEKLPKVLKRMQKTLWQGGYGSFDALLRELRSFELDPQPALVDALPASGSVASLSPTPESAYVPASEVMGTVAAPETFAPSGKASHLSGALDAARAKALKRKQLQALVAGAAALAIGFAGMMWYLSKPAEPKAEFTQPALGHTSSSVEQSTAHAESNTKATPVAAQEPSLPPVQQDVQASPAEIPPSPVDNTPQPPLATPGPSEPQNDLRKRAEAGDAKSQTELGLAYRNGKGVPQDNEQAVKWYRKAAEQGEPDAQAYLGFMYMTGRGVTRDDKEAARWHRKAAEAGSALGQYNLGLMYMHGRGGLDQSNVNSFAWLKLSAEGGNAAARSQLATLEQQMGKADLQEATRMVANWKTKHKN